MTHADLVDHAKRWLLSTRHCGWALAEFSTGKVIEIPDAWGMTSKGETVLIECKISRSDFFADRKKPFRAHSEQGMGQYRYYMCPMGLIQPEDIPEKWGLLWVGDKRIRRKKHAESFERWNRGAERQVMYMVIRRTFLTGGLEPVGENSLQEVSKDE